MLIETGTNYSIYTNRVKNRKVVTISIRLKNGTFDIKSNTVSVILNPTALGYLIEDLKHKFEEITK